MKTSSSYLPEHFQKEIEALSSEPTKEKVPSQIHELIVRIHHHQSIAPYHKEQLFKAIEKNETLAILYKEAT